VPRGFLVTAIDIGSSRIKGVVGEINDEKIEIKAFATINSRGIENGEIKDAVAFKDSIENLLVELETQEPRQPDSYFCVTFSTPSTSLKISNTEERFSERRVIDDEIVIELLERFTAEKSKSDEMSLHNDSNDNKENSENSDKKEKLSFSPLLNEHKTLHVVPKRYIIDGVKNVSNPIDMEASILGIEASLITVDKVQLDALKKLLEDTNVIDPIFYSPTFAASELLLSVEEKERGTVCLNIGYSSTDFIVYFNGVPVYMQSILLGMKNVIRDIAQVLETSFEEAERLLIQHGLSSYEMVKEDIKIPYMMLDGKTQNEVSLKKLALIIYARLREILGNVKREIRKAENTINQQGGSGIPGGIVIIGGGAKVRGIVETAIEIFKLPVRVGKVEKVEDVELIDEARICEDPIYLPGIGSILLFYNEEMEFEMEGPRKRKSEGLFKKLWELFKKLV
jgi:cell division protein FtsA